MTSAELEPGVGVLLILFLLFFLLLVLPMAVAAVVVTQMHIKLPPAVEPILPWRAAILAGLIFGALLLLILQAVSGFKLESKMQEVAEKYTPPAPPGTAPGSDQTAEDKLKKEYKYAQVYSGFGIAVTLWFKLVLFLFLVALVGAGLDFWLERRGNRPVPRTI